MRTRAAVEGDRLDRADGVDGAHRRPDDGPAGLDREPRLGDPERPALVLDDLGRSRWRAARVATGRPGWCRRCRSRRRGPSRASRRRARRRPGRAAPAPGGRRPRSRRCRRSGCRCGSAGRAARRPGAAVHPAYGLEGVTAGDREAELLVLVRGGDVLVGVRLDAGGHAHHHRARVRPALGGDLRPAARSRAKESTMIRPTPERDGAAQLGERSCCCRGSRSAPSVEAGRARRRSSSPPEQTSRRSPSSATQRATVVQRKALPA